MALEFFNTSNRTSQDVIQDSKNCIIVSVAETQVLMVLRTYFETLWKTFYHSSIYHYVYVALIVFVI